MEKQICITTNKILEKSKIKVEYNNSWLKTHWPLHWHKGYEIYYFQQGDANYIIGDRVYDLQPGDMLIFNGERLHRVNPFGDTYRRSYINFVPEYVSDYLKEDLFTKIIVPFESENGLLIKWTLSEREEVELILARIQKEKDKETIGYESMMRFYLSQLLIKVYRKISGMDSNLEDDGSAYNPQSYHVQRILKFINQNYTNPISLDTISKSLHLNKYYMCHCFKKVTGETINKHLSNRRIEEGKKLLVSTEQSISSISDEIGLSNPIHFSRLFKQTVGMSPKEYRQKQIKSH
ncbi:AraC family transcriptional regulator [Aquibacillus salsiterrae]|uniref:AraC family transcriptional regulator n=1 Tax=Aquibacillus salsiterrae TaxID=2950439 RepID=A0A9X3WCS2_9BACI|nr:AraC family transcriptional regulator [Aquibacillus salsiterrae]MDC3416016.1 AraC family transcriptional regulator [Aquibacillus salsiterrae]